MDARATATRGNAARSRLAWRARRIRCAAQRCSTVHAQQTLGLTRCGSPGAQVSDYKDKVLRAHAEMENLRERTKRQSESDRKFAVQALLKDLLDVADNLRRALQALPPAVAAAAESGTPPEAAGGEGEAAATANALHQLAVGVSMTDKVLAKALSKHGAVRFDPLGEEFDPASMAALFKVPVAQAGGKKAGTVAMVTKAGYRLNDRVIRPADVGVVQD
jgi:molecular chaperone GrpE